MNRAIGTGDAPPSSKKSLSSAEQLVLLRAAKEGEKAARDALVQANLPFVYGQAHYYVSHGSHLDHAELVSEGVLGMLRAIEKFDLDQPVTFLTYAAYWIRQSMSRALAATRSPLSGTISIHIKVSCARWHRLKLRFREEGLDGDALFERLAREFNIGIERARTIDAYYGSIRMVSLDAPLGDDDSVSLHDLLPSSAPAVDAEVKEGAAAVRDRIESLSLTRQRMSQLEAGFIARIQPPEMGAPLVFPKPVEAVIATQEVSAREVETAAPKVLVREVKAAASEVAAPEVEADGGVEATEELPSLPGVRRVASEFALLCERGSRRGFLELVLPSSFEEMCAEARVLRDAEGEGRCVRCRAPAEGYRCEACKRDHNESVGRKRAERKQAGLCIFCGGALPCAKCAGRSNVRIAELRARRRLHGMCEFCGLPALPGPGGLCAEHRAIRLPKARNREAQKRQKRALEGQCRACGKQPPVAGGSTCEACRKRAKVWKTARRNARTVAENIGQINDRPSAR